MAEACRLGNYNSDRKFTSNQDETFCVFNVLCVFISLVTILADLTTDILVFVEYCNNGYLFWALATFTFIFSPNILINTFSMRWFVIDQNSSLRHWITHICLAGLLERYILFLRKVFICKNLESIQAQKLISQRNDLSLLHFLYIFTGTIPQIILQSFAIIILNDNYHTKAFALIASIASVVWGCTIYFYTVIIFFNEKFQWNSLFLRLVWHFGMLIARIAGILLFVVYFEIWTLVPLGLHWAAMTLWIIVQKTTFCPNKFEETFYNVIMGFVYCFCYINLREGHTRYRVMMFYTLMITQNFGSLFLFVILSDLEQQRKPWAISATICIIMGTVLGLCAMIIYYRYFHSKGPIAWKKNNDDIELNNKIKVQNGDSNNKGNKLNHIRSFKSLKKDHSTINNNRKIAKTEDHQNEAENAKKNFLLYQWMARSGTPTFTSAPVGDNSIDVCSIEMHTVENTPQLMNCPSDEPNVKINARNKKKRICSPTQLTLKLSSLDNLESSIDEITCSNLNLQKRRGICSSDELRDDLTNLNLYLNNIVNENFVKTIKFDHVSEISHDTDGSNKKTSSDSIDMDLDLSFSDINSSDINTFNENIVQKLCLSALKNIKVGNQDADIENIQRIALDILKEMYAKKGKNKNKMNAELISTKNRDLDTPTEMLSVHDYENICAVNIAREAWGIRSWNGYCDIENWLHDGSVVRDRRRDTLTSGSSEISSCVSQELKSALLTAPPFPKKAPTYSNVFVKFDRSSQDDYNDTITFNSNDETFLAKPCVIDSSRDPYHLEPIMEELDDLGDIDIINKKRLNSESSLVATIDEIRKATITNSPNNVYHRRDHLFHHSPEFNASTKIDNNLKRALYKEPSKFNSSNTMESLPEKQHHANVSLGTKIEPKRKDFNIIVDDIDTTIETALSENLPCHSKSFKTIEPSIIEEAKNQNRKSNILSDIEESNPDLTDNDIVFLWQLVSENCLPVNSTEDLSSNKITTSLQSLIQKDSQASVVNASTSKPSAVKKGARHNKPRRKFSILRERFETKPVNSDREILCQSDIAVPHLPDNVVNVKNQFPTSNDKISMVSQVKHSNVLLCDDTKQNNIDPTLSGLVLKNVKDRRSLFMKQVLSPPKFNTKLKYKI